MFPEPLYDLLSFSRVGWLSIAIAYALFDYALNFFMCWLTGGLQQVRQLPKAAYRRKKNIVDREIRQKLAKVAFKSGANQRLNEFRNDSASWYWPLTILAIPIAFYGIIKTSIWDTVNLLNIAGIPIGNYRVVPFTLLSNQTQYFIVFVALVNSGFSFYRYQRARIAPTWFSKSIVFHILRLILFDAPLSYLIFNIIISYLDFFSSLYFTLSDISLTYNALHPDLMYGLRPAYDELLLLITLMTIISFLPTVMLIRERKEKYKWIYYLLFVVGISIAVIFISSTLIYQFHIRLESIHRQSIESIIQQTNLSLDSIAANTNLSMRESVGLQYYALIKEFPSGFIIPNWLQYILSFRLILLLFEFLSLGSPREDTNTKEDSNSGKFAILQRFIEVFS